MRNGPSPLICQLITRNLQKYPVGGLLELSPSAAIFYVPHVALSHIKQHIANYRPLSSVLCTGMRLLPDLCRNDLGVDC